MKDHFRWGFFGKHLLKELKRPLSRATNISLQGLPKDIYIFINHYTDAKDIWDNVKMLLKGSELTKEDRESKLGNPRGGGAAGYGGAHNRVGNANQEKMLLMQAQENGVALDEEHLLFLTDDCDAFDFDVDEAPMAQTMFMANLSSTDPVYDEAYPSYDSNILSEYVKDNAMSGVQSNVSSVLNDAYMMIYNDIEPKIDEQLRIVITGHNFKEETLKKEPHYVKFQLASTINHNKSMVEDVTSLKKDFKQKENKYLEEFLDMKSLKVKVEDRLYKQEQSLQIVHMLCKLKPYYNELNKVAIGYKNPLCFTRAKQVQPALYNGHEIIKNNHVPSIVHNTEDTLVIAEITRRKMNDKMKDPKYLIKMKAKALKEQTTASRPIKALTVYPPNIPATLVLRVLPTKCQVKINIFTLIQFFSEFDKTCKKKITPTGLTKGKGVLNKLRNVFSRRFTEMHVAHTIVKAHCLELEVELSNLRDKIHNDNHNEAFTASSTIPSIYIQQFWDTIRYDKDTARYNCQLDEKWFDLTKDTLRYVLQITPVNNNIPFSSPPTPDALINFVNNLGYPKVIRTLSAGKKKANPIMIPSIRFTNLIIHHLQSKHKFHPRPDSPLHLPYEEYIFGYLKFSAKGTKQEVFGMPILNELITANIRGSDPDSPAPKPAKATKKSKPSAPKAAPVTKPAIAKASKSTSSQQPKPKLVLPRLKKRNPTRSLSLVDKFVDEGIPEKEPRFDDKEADMQMAVEESLKSVHDAHRGLLPPMVFREPDSGKFQPLPKRGTPAPTEPSSHAETLLIHAKLGLTNSDMESNKEVPPVVKTKAQDEGQIGPNPGVQIKGRAGLNHSDEAKPQPQSSLVVHFGPNLEHIDHEATNENLKLTVEENEKTTAETKDESMVSVTVHQDTSVIPPMTSSVVDLIYRPDSPNDHRLLPSTATTIAKTTTIITTLPLPPLPQQGTTYSILIKLWLI
nr:hypothetical protein [Tanacetum cinerariifolium]